MKKAILKLAQRMSRTGTDSVEMTQEVSWVFSERYSIARQNPVMVGPGYFEPAAPGQARRADQLLRKVSLHGVLLHGLSRGELSDLIDLFTPPNPDDLAFLAQHDFTPASLRNQTRVRHAIEMLTYHFHERRRSKGPEEAPHARAA